MIWAEAHPQSTSLACTVLIHVVRNFSLSCLCGSRARRGSSGSEGGFADTSSSGGEGANTATNTAEVASFLAQAIQEGLPRPQCTKPTITTGGSQQKQSQAPPLSSSAGSALSGGGDMTVQFTPFHSTIRVRLKIILNLETMDGSDLPTVLMPS